MEAQENKDILEKVKEVLGKWEIILLKAKNKKPIKTFYF